MSIKLTDQQQQELLAYVEGALSPDAAARVEIFLANTDPQLASQIADMIEQRRILTSLPKLKAPVDMTQRIMEQVERESLLDDRQQDLDTRPWWQSRWLMAASVLMVLSAFGYFVIHAALKNSDTMDKWVLTRNDPPAKEKILADHDEAAVPAPLQAEQKAGAREQALSADESQNVARGADGSHRRQQLASQNQMGYQQANVQNNSPATNHELQQGGQLASVPQTGAVAARKPIVVTLAARDSSDIERLRLLLLSISGPAASRSVAISSAPKPAAAPVRSETVREKEASDSHTAGEMLSARLSPESFRRIASQFTVIRIQSEVDSSSSAATQAVSSEREALAQSLTYTGEADYLFRFAQASGQIEAGQKTPAGAAASQPGSSTQPRN